MVFHCLGKQGTYLKVSGNSGSNSIVSQTSLESIQASSINAGFAVWRVYTATTVNGRVVEAYRGAFGKSHTESFIIYKPTATSNRLTRSGAPTGTLTSWTSSTTSWVSRTEFSHGDPVTLTYTTTIKEGQKVLLSVSQPDGYHTVEELACGCDTADCQMGIFPTNFCCTNCAQQSVILQEIISTLQARNNG